jgi:hypothetical protein
MEADWEVEVGGGAPVIDALWPGFVDLRSSPERIGEIAEAAAFPALASLLLKLNGAESPLWTAKCDLWEPETDELVGGETQVALACYIDLLPFASRVFAQWSQAESFCREWVARLAPRTSSLAALNLCSQSLASQPECRVDLIVRQAIAGETQGFGVTAYLSAAGADRTAAAEALKAVLAAFAGTIFIVAPPVTSASKLQ